VKRKKVRTKREILNSILEGRLELPSVRRYLEENKLPISTSFFQSADFKEKFYNTWSEYKKKDFLFTMAGVEWKEMQIMIEKE